MNLLPITDAIKNGEPVLVKFRCDLRESFDPDGVNRSLVSLEGIWAVMRRMSPDEYDGWGFAAPVGVGGYPDEWFEGWLPLPSNAGDDVRTKSYRRALAKLEGHQFLAGNLSDQQLELIASDAPFEIGVPPKQSKGASSSERAATSISEIEITTEEDWHSCETCGGSSDEGGRVVIDGEMVFEYKPLAHCFYGSNYDYSDLLFLALDKAGVKITVDGRPPYALIKNSPDGEG